MSVPEPTNRQPLGNSQEVFWSGRQGALVGLSTDVKPTTGARGEPLAAGTRFRCRDTGDEFEFDGAAVWALLPPDPGVTAAAKLADAAPFTGQLILLSAVLSELRAIRTLLATANGMPAIFEPLPLLRTDPNVF